MIKDTKRGIFILVEVVSFIVFILLCLGIFLLFENKSVDDNEINADVKKVSLQYVINYDLNMNVSVSLEKEEMEELFDLVKSLEFGASETKCVIEPVYYLEYGENKLYLDETCGLALYNDKEYSVTKGGEKITDFLKKKIDILNKVYLFKFDQNSGKAEIIEIDDDGKNQIRSIWSNHSKETMTMNLAILLQYYLYIDGDVIGIDELDDYVSYNAAASHVMMLNQEMRDILNNYIKNSGDECCSCCPNLKPGESCIDLCCPCSGIGEFKIEDYKKEIEEFGPLFNKNKGADIKTREDAIEDAKKLWKDCLKFEENEKYPLTYKVSYDDENDCYLVRANVMAENILGGGASLIIKSNGEVIALWGEN